MPSKTAWRPKKEQKKNKIEQKNRNRNNKKM